MKTKDSLKNKKVSDKFVHTDQIHYYVKPYKFVSVTNPLKFWNHFLNYKNRFFMVMHKHNGHMELNYVYNKTNLFVFENGVYIINKDSMKWSDTLQTFVGYYVQGISLPVNLDIDDNLLKEGVKDKLKETRVQANVDANILFSTVNTEVIQKLMKGEELEKFLNQLKNITFIGIAVSLLTLGIIAWKFLG